MAERAAQALPRSTKATDGGREPELRDPREPKPRERSKSDTGSQGETDLREGKPSLQDDRNGGKAGSKPGTEKLAKIPPRRDETRFRAGRNGNGRGTATGGRKERVREDGYLYRGSDRSREDRPEGAKGNGKTTSGTGLTNRLLYRDETTASKLRREGRSKTTPRGGELTRPASRRGDGETDDRANSRPATEALGETLPSEGQDQTTSGPKRRRTQDRD
jgi:hypothetical protein